MQVGYLVDTNLIPDDGSSEVIARFADRVDDASCAMLIYPDVHYKKGSRSVNGMLVASDDRIFPALLGVANCGFTFGRLEGARIEQKEQLLETFAAYAKSAGPKPLSIDQTRTRLAQYVREAMERTTDRTFEFCGVHESDDIEALIDSVCPASVLRAASHSLGYLGGGNHFFELHRVNEIYAELNGLRVGDIVFVLHSDSGFAGNLINLLFSNLSELDYLSGLAGHKRRLAVRLSQLRYFSRFGNLVFKNVGETVRLLFSNRDQRSLNAHSELGKKLLLAFAIASAVGDMNRNQILDDYIDSARMTGMALRCDVYGSHSHDSVSVEKTNGRGRIIHRNGVQYVADSSCFMLPGALGTESFLFLNPKNEDAYLSANHGLGRLLDKHLAKEEFREGETEDKLRKDGTHLFRVGSGNLAEQHPGAFKNVESVAKVMERYNLGKRGARMQPIVVMKG